MPFTLLAIWLYSGMILLIGILSVLFGLNFWLGYLHKLRLQHLSKSRIINSFLALMLVLTLMTVAHRTGLLSQALAADITMGIYSIVTGFFVGSGCKLMQLSSNSGTLNYWYQSFWTKIAPNAAIVVLVAFGIYRTGLFIWDFSGLGITSGLSLVGFGFWGWTLNIVPQFRSKGILLLDQLIKWQQVASYSWKSEEAIQIFYFNQAGELTDFITYVPNQDQLVLERLLGNKIREHEENQNEELHKDHNT